MVAQALSGLVARVLERVTSLLRPNRPQPERSLRLVERHENRRREAATGLEQRMATDEGRRLSHAAGRFVRSVAFSEPRSRAP